MTYELAKQLKDAGFPQKESGWGYLLTKQRPDYPIRAGIIPTEDVCYVPTLSELIEACGDEFELLTPGWNEWVASTDYENYYHATHGTGKTPEEAVAKLWLALNKKQ